MNRRGFLLEAAGLLAAPAIVRVSAIMPVKALPPVVWGKIVLSGVDVSGNPDVTMTDVTLTDEGFYHFPVKAEDTSKFSASSRYGTPCEYPSTYPRSQGISG